MDYFEFAAATARAQAQDVMNRRDDGGIKQPSSNHQPKQENEAMNTTITGDVERCIYIDNSANRTAETAERLEYLRGEIRAEQISYEELSELQGLAEFIEPGDVELLEWAGVPEFPEEG